MIDFQSIILWLSGSGQWQTLSVSLNKDSVMTPIVVALNGAVGLFYFWIALYWRKCERQAGSSVAKDTMSILRNIFIWGSLSGFGFHLIQLVWPAWWIWVATTLVLLYYCIKFVIRMRRGFVLMYKDAETIQVIRDRLEFAETSRMELDALKEQMCEVKSLVSRTVQG